MRQHALVVALVLVAFPAAAAVLSLLSPTESTATATIGLSAPDEAAQEQLRSGRSVATTRELLSLRAVAQRASRSLPGTSVDEVEERVNVRSAPDADVLNVEATGDTRDSAVSTADAYADAYVSFARGIQPSSLRPGDAAVVQRAGQPSQSEARPLIPWVLGGLAAGLVAALLAALLLQRVDRRVTSVAELEEIYGLPVLAQIPRSSSLAKRGRSARAEATSRTVGFSEEAEAFRALRTNLRYFNVDSSVRSLLVASPLPGDGKSTVARYLAITMASMGDSVCLVNADLRKRDAGSVQTPEGLSLVLAGFDLDTALTEVPVAFDPVSEESRVLVELASGPLPPNPSELLESARMRWLISTLEDRFDLVIIDSPALVTVSDALSLVPAASGILVVGGVGRTMRQAAIDLTKQVELLGGRPLGVVANFSAAPRRYDYYDDPRGSGRSSRPRDRATA